MSISRYKAVNMLLTEEQLRQFSSLRISTSAVLAIADAYSSGYKEESQQLIEMVISNQISTAADIKGTFQIMLQEKNKPYNLLPGGEAPADDVDESLDADIEEGSRSSKSPAEALMSSEHITDAEVVDDDEEDDKEDAAKSQSKKDAIMMLRTVRKTISAVRHDLTQIWRDLPSELDSIVQAQDVILGDDESSDEFNSLLSGVFQDAQQALLVLIEQLVRGTEFGYIQHQLKMPEKGKQAFCGCGLFNQDE